MLDSNIRNQRDINEIIFLNKLLAYFFIKKDLLIDRQCQLIKINVKLFIVC